MQYSATTEALLHAIKNDVRNRVDDIVDYAEHAAMSLTSETEVDKALERALLEVAPGRWRGRFTESGCTRRAAAARGTGVSGSAFVTWPLAVLSDLPGFSLLAVPPHVID